MTAKPVLPGDAFFFLRPTSVEAQAYRIAAIPLTRQFGGTVAQEFYLTVQRARDVNPDDWSAILSDLHTRLHQMAPFRLQATGLWRFYSDFRQTNTLFWTIPVTKPLSSLRQIIDDVLQNYNATTYPFSLDEWKPHTPALHNVQGEEAELALLPGLSPPSFFVRELWLTVYQPWGAFVEHPLVIFIPS